MRKFSARRPLLFAAATATLLLLALILLPKLGFDLPGLIKSSRGFLRAQASNTGVLAGKSVAWWDGFRENYRIKAPCPETESLKEQARQLNEKYGVKVDYSTKVSSWGWGYAEGYNSAASRTLDEKFQRNVAKELLRAQRAEAIRKAGDR